MAEGINDFLNRFILASGTFRRLTDMMDVSEKLHSENARIVQYLSGFIFQCCAALYILGRCFCSLPITLQTV